MPGIPIAVYDPELGMFRVKHAVGKCFSSGGYGVHVSERSRESTRAAKRAGEEVNKGSNSDNKKDTAASGAPSDSKRASEESGQHQGEHLFIEEALFLLERGLVQVFDEDETTLLDSAALFAMLHELSVPISVYLAYAYLRQQTFIVLRHSHKRIALSRAIQEELESAKDDAGTAVDRSKTNGTKEEIPSEATSNGDDDGDEDDGPTTTTSRKKRRRGPRLQQLMYELREDMATARPPIIMEDSKESHQNKDDDDDDEQASIAFDVYKPNSGFRRTNPGPPDFYVAITSFAAPSSPFPRIQRLVAACQAIPLRLATVSDGGTVIMFGLTDVCVPPIERGGDMPAVEWTQK